MPHSGPRILLAMLCTLLAFAASASADCAWVLWVRGSSGIVGDPYNWLVDTAHENKQECRRRLEENISNMVSGGARRLTNPDIVSIDLGKEGDLLKNMTMGFFCLPDTVDPRGSKGK